MVLCTYCYFTLITFNYFTSALSTVHVLVLDNYENKLGSTVLYCKIFYDKAYAGTRTYVPR